MSITTIIAAIIAIAESDLVTPGTFKATIDPPPGQIDTNHLPGLFVLTGEAQDDTETFGDDTIIETREYMLHCPIAAKGNESIETIQATARTLIPTVKAVYAGYPNLGGTDGVLMSEIIGDSGVIVLPTYDEKFIGFEVRLRVQEIVHRTYASYE